MEERDFGNWTWSSSEGNREEFLDALPDTFDKEYWFTEHGSASDYFTIIEKAPGSDSCMVGTLPFPGIKGKGHSQVHYILTDNRFTTLESMGEIHDLFSEKRLETVLPRCQTAVEGFLSFIGEVLNSYLRDLYPTIKHIKMLHGRIMKGTTKQHFGQLVDFQHKIVSWNNTLEPVREIFMAIRELKGQDITSSMAYQEPHARMERILMMLKRNDRENKKLLDLDDKLVQYRGNEIMKTLTVFTVLATPITAFGALWGMNFKYMPELDEKFGYLFALIMILVTSGFIYFWLRKKGWTGNLLEEDERD